jgi:hypothetical protein
MRAPRLAPALALAATVAASAVAHADPAVPPGWIAGGAASPMAPAKLPGPKSRQALQLAQLPAQAALAPEPVALDTLDTVEIAPAPTDREVAASNADAQGDPPEDLFLDRGCQRASVSGHAVGIIDVGWLSLPIAPRSGGGVLLYGVRGERGLGDGQHRYVRASWETVDRLPDNNLRFTETVARFEVAACKAFVVRRFSAIARPVLDGRAFLFRTRCPACGPDARDELHAITPPFELGVEPYAHRRIGLGPGRAAGFAHRADAFQTGRFAEATGRPAPALAPGFDALVGIEAAQGLGEAEPTVIAYAAHVLHPRFF